MSILIKIFLIAFSTSLLPYAFIKFIIGIHVPGIHFAFIGVVILIKLGSDKKLTNTYINTILSHNLSKTQKIEITNNIRIKKDLILILIGLTIFIIHLLS